MVITFLISVKCTVAEFALLEERVDGRARKVPLGAHMLPTCSFATKAYVAGIALVLGMVMPLRIAMLIASPPCGKVFDAVATLEHRAGNLMQRLMKYDGGCGGARWS